MNPISINNFNNKPISDKNILKSFNNYFLVFLLIALSGFPFFTAQIIFLVIALFYASIVFQYRKIKIDKFFVITILLLTILVIGQSVIFKFISMETTLGLYVRWTFPYLVIKIIWKEFPQRYINVLYYLVIISFLFYFPSLLIPGFHEFLSNSIAPIFRQTKPDSFYDYRNNILIYTVDGSRGIFNFFRNPGPFWEPGAFSGYIIIALIFNLIKNKKFINKKNIIFLIAIFTTFSTAGYLALLFLIASYFLLNKKKAVSFSLVPLVIFISILVYQNIEIINYKINYSLEELSSPESYYSHHRTRILTALLDLEDVSNYPIFGRGRNSMTRYGNISRFTYLEHRNNGITNFAVKYGLPFWFLYFFMFYLFFKGMCKKNLVNHLFSLAIIGTIFIIGFAETYFQMPVFIGLYYLGFVYKKYYINYKKRNINPPNYV